MSREYSSSLGWLDFHARMGVYLAASGDPTIARWHVPDPLASQTPHENPYLYCGGNPVNLTDPTGLSYLDDMINGKLDGFWYRGEHLTNNDGVYYGDDSGAISVAKPKEPFPILGKHRQNKALVKHHLKQA